MWYRCSKTGQNEEKVIRGGLFIWKKCRVEKGRNKALQKGRLIHGKRENKICESCDQDCMPSSPELDYSSCRAMYQTCCPDHTTQAQPASVVRRMGRRRAAFPGKSREHPKTDQASWCHRVPVHAKSDSTTIFSTTSKHSCRAFVFKLDQIFEPIYSMAPKIVASMQ